MSRPGTATSRRQFLRLSSTLLLGATLKPAALFGRIISPLPLIERAAFTMGSIVTIKAYHADARLCNLAIDGAFREMKIVDGLMSVFDVQSQISLLNHEGRRKETAVDSRIIEVLENADRIHRLTVGGFDPTIEPLMELFGFRDENAVHHYPSDRTIAATLDAVGMRNVTFNRRLSTIGFEHPKTKLDFGGIAVGFAIDRAAGVLRSHGIESAIVNHSGDIYAIGAPPDDTAWDIGITDPRASAGIITTLRIRNQALSTSGNYENSLRADGNTIGHILNPSTGKTATTILSGTVIAPTAIEADALSTGFFVLGIEKSRTIIRQSTDVEFIAVVDDTDEERVIHIAR